MYSPALPSRITHVTLADPPSWSSHGLLSLRVLISCSAPPGHGAVMLLLTLGEGQEHVHVTDVIVGDDVTLPPCVALATAMPSGAAALERRASAALEGSASAALERSVRVPLLWIAGLGLDSLWMSLTLPESSSSSSSPAAAAAAAAAAVPARVTVARECSGLNLGAHASSCLGDV